MENEENLFDGMSREDIANMSEEDRIKFLRKTYNTSGRKKTRGNRPDDWDPEWKNKYIDLDIVEDTYKNTLVDNQDLSIINIKSSSKKKQVVHKNVKVLRISKMPLGGELDFIISVSIKENDGKIFKYKPNKIETVNSFIGDYIKIEGDYYFIKSVILPKYHMQYSGLESDVYCIMAEYHGESIKK